MDDDDDDDDSPNDVNDEAQRRTERMKSDVSDRNEGNHALKDAGPGSRRKTLSDTGTTTVPTGDNQDPCRA